MDTRKKKTGSLINSNELGKLTDIIGLIGAGLEIETAYPEEINIIENPQTYPIKKKVWDNWLPFTYRAFKELNRYASSQAKSFASIGSSNGADAIGALLNFQHLEEIILTDIDSKALNTAILNVEAGALQCSSIEKLYHPLFRIIHRKKAQSQQYNPFDQFKIRTINLTGLIGSVCSPLQKSGKKVDLIYENLPNLPLLQSIIEKENYFSHFNTKDLQNITFSPLEEQALLQSHAAVLETAKHCLNPNGVVVCSIGGRIPYSTIECMVEERGYHCQLLTAGFKKQTELTDVLPGYIEAEEKYGARFSFYYYNPENVRTGIHEYEKYLTNRLEPYTLSAHDTWEIIKKIPPFEVGHIVYIIAARLKK